jgi:hypothetical protein
MTRRFRHGVRSQKISIGAGRLINSSGEMSAAVTVQRSHRHRCPTLLQPVATGFLLFAWTNRAARRTGIETLRRLRVLAHCLSRFA